MKIKRQLHWFIYALFVLSCARVSSPTGGPKDTIPPKLIAANPAHEELNFHGNQISLTFSETVVLNNPKEQIIITPTIGKKFDVEARNNKVILSYETKLTDSTTYTFNFREAVQDITEKNPARNLKLALSTGSYIDSLSVTGTIYNALNKKPLKDVTVALQPYSDTFDIFKHQPTYFTKTNEKGLYTLENLKHGKYQLYSYSDQNKNLVVDSKSEAYGFKSDVLNLDTVLIKQDAHQVRLDMRPLKLTTARPYNTYYNIRTSKNLSSFKVVAEDSLDVYIAYGADRSNLVLYNTFQDRDSIALKIHLEDSVNNTYDTTLWAKFSQRPATPEKFSFEVNEQRLLAHRGTYNLKFTFSKPLKEIDFDSLYYQVDSLTRINFTSEELDYNEPEKILTINKKIDPKLFPAPETRNGPPRANAETDSTQLKKINELVIGKGAFISVEQDSSKSIRQQVKPLFLENLGVIIASAPKTTDPIIIQLLDTKGKVLQEVVNKQQATFEDLNPADYLLRIIVDKNNNGRWDPGNFYKRSEPEPVHYYENEKAIREIKLKANFELGPLLITY